MQRRQAAQELKIKSWRIICESIQIQNSDALKNLVYYTRVHIGIVSQVKILWIKGSLS